MNPEYYAITKAIHIIFMVSYFAGIFYIVRLFIYHTEANQTENEAVLKKQFLIMEKKLWNIIIVPASVIMLATGLTLLLSNTILLKQPWVHVKLTFIALLSIYHLWIWLTLKKLKKNLFPFTSKRLRLYNEIATLILFVVVFAVTLKNLFTIYWYWVFITFVLIGLIIFTIVKFSNPNK